MTATYDTSSSVGVNASSVATYVGDPSAVFLEAISAKVAGHLTEEEFKLVVTGAQTSSVRQLEARLLPSSDTPISMTQYRVQTLWRWLTGRPIVGTLLIVLLLSVVGIMSWGLTAAVQTFYAWLGLHIVSVGVTVFIVMVMVLIFKALTVQSRRANADMWSARNGGGRSQDPVHINIER